MYKKERFDYFNEFIRMTEYIVRTAGILKDTVTSYDVNKLEDVINDVHRLENRSDTKVQLIRNNLITDFLPPIDREDIAIISKKLDNIEDGIDEAMIKFNILNITEMRKDVIELVDILVSSCKAVNDMFINLRNFKDVNMINKKVDQIVKLEEQGDKVFEKLISNLYSSEKDLLNIIKWSKIYNCLEATIDVCEEVSDCIVDTVMKNS